MRRLALPLLLSLGALPARPALRTTPAPTAAPASGQAPSCAAGAKLEVVWRGTWYPATTKGGPDAGGRCLIGYDGFGANWDEWVGADRMRRPAAAPAPGAPPPGRVALGDYNCVSFVGSVTAGGHLVHVGEFRVTGPNTYTSRGASGRYSYDARAGRVVFQGGPWDGQRADYGGSPRPAFHVYGPSGRTVEDCDGPAR